MPASVRNVLIAADLHLGSAGRVIAMVAALIRAERPEAALAEATRARAELEAARRELLALYDLRCSADPPFGD